jgi:DNA polymerase III subunit beta
MEVEVLQENLTRALSNVGRVANSKAGLPILSNILIRSDGNQLLIAATNLEIASTQKIGVKIIQNGSITVPARLVIDFIQNLPKGKITLSVKNNILSIKSKNGQSKINGQSDEEFPELPVIDEANVISETIPMADFKQSVNQTIIAASSDAARQVLTGVYWHSHGGNIYLASTDGYRLAEKLLKKTSNTISAIIPVDVLQEVLRTVDEQTEAIDVLFDETQVRFRFNDNEITSRLIDGNFPDYRQLIPQNPVTTSIVDRAELTRIVKISRIFSKDTGGGINLTVDQERKLLETASIASESGESTLGIDGENNGDNGTISLNSKYLIDALSVIDSATVQVCFSGKLAPTQLIPQSKDESYKHIIMPIKS